MWTTYLHARDRLDDGRLAVSDMSDRACDKKNARGSSVRSAGGRDEVTRGHRTGKEGGDGGRVKGAGKEGGTEGGTWGGKSRINSIAQLRAPVRMRRSFPLEKNAVRTPSPRVVFSPRPPSRPAIQPLTSTLTNVDGCLPADDLGRQRVQLRDVQLGQVLRLELAASREAPAAAAQQRRRRRRVAHSLSLVSQRRQIARVSIRSFVEKTRWRGALARTRSPASPSRLR